MSTSNITSYEAANNFGISFMGWSILRKPSPENPAQPSRKKSGPHYIRILNCLEPTGFSKELDSNVRISHELSRETGKIGTVMRVTGSHEETGYMKCMSQSLLEDNDGRNVYVTSSGKTWLMEKQTVYS